MKKKIEWHFDIEIITDFKVNLITTFNLSNHYIKRGLTLQELKNLLKTLPEQSVKTTINIRGVNY